MPFTSDIGYTLRLIIARDQFVSGHLVCANSRPFVSDTTPKWIDQEGLEKHAIPRLGNFRSFKQFLIYWMNCSQDLLLRFKTVEGTRKIVNAT